MKRDRRTEGENILREAENTLRESLREILPQVVVSGEPLFFNSQFNSYDLPLKKLPEESEALLQAALACLEMREALALPIEGSVGELFLASCKEASSTDAQRRGPRRLAAALLDRLRNAV